MLCGKAKTLKNQRFPVKACSWPSRRGTKRTSGSRVPLGRMDLPDLAPWFDNVSDGYDELPAADHEAAYDE